MQTTAETLEGNKVKLTIEVGEEEFRGAIDGALSEMASQIRLPGFRPGHAPKKLVESRIGRDAIREEALRDAIPGYIRQAVEETGTDAIGSPSVEVTSAPEDTTLVFDAIVEVRPQPTIAGYEGLKVTIPSPAATEDEVDARIDRMRDQHGTLEVVSRPAVTGDHLTIDVAATRHGAPVEHMNTEDFLYELGSAGIVEPLDDQIAGAKAGDIFQFNAVPPGSDEEATFRILVKEVKEKILPEADDQWAAEASEFSTLAELRDDTRTRIGEIKKFQSNLALRSESARALAELVTDDVPGSLVDEELAIRMRDLSQRLAAQGATLPQYLAATGQSPEALVESLRESATDTVRLDLALRSLAGAEEIEATEEEVDDKIASLAEAMETDAATVRHQIEHGQGLDAVRWEIRKSKALAWLEEHVDIEDIEGNAIERAALEPLPPAVSDGEAPDSPDAAEGATEDAATSGDSGSDGVSS